MSFPDEAMRVGFVVKRYPRYSETFVVREILAHERAGLGALLQRVVKTATVVMAEHDVHVVRSVATRVTAFAEGKKIAEGDADEVFEADAVRRVFLRGRRDD